MLKTRTLQLVLGILPALMAAAGAAAKPGYYRYPDLHGDRLVFTAEGDLWSAQVDGSDARRLTSHPGDEGPAKFSPDGRWIAFSGDYDGNRDLFIMPAEGGEPRRLIWHPAPDDPVGWTPAGDRIIFRSYRLEAHFQSELYLISPEGGEPERLPINRVVLLDIDPESGRWAFQRTWGGGTWKRYRGGTAPEIWVGHPDRADFVEVTDFDGLAAYPMWHDGRIYFLSDQGGTSNIWSMQPDGTDRRRHTDFGKWDARYPSMGPEGRIVFMLAGEIHLYNPADGSEGAIPIDLPSERALARTRYPEPSRYLSGFALAPEGDRLAVSTRGEIFSVPAEEGVTLPITRGSGARENRVSYHPEGKQVVFITDETGNEEIAVADAWGRGSVRKLESAKATGWHFPPLWSPDGKRIAYADQTQTLYVMEADGGAPREVDHGEQHEIREYAWSPDGRWLAYAKHNRLDFGSIFIYDTKEKATHRITSWTTDDRSPAWDPEGRYLYFISDRMMNPVIGWQDFETIVVEPSKLYMVLLRPDVKNPFLETEGAPPGDDEEKEEDEEEKDGDQEEKNGDEKKEKPEPVEIEFDGIMRRVVELPVEAGRYQALGAAEEKLFYLSGPLRGLAEEPSGEAEDPKGTLMAFDLEKKESEVFLQGVSAYELQTEAKKIAVMKKRGELFVVDAGSPPGDDLSESRVSLSGLSVELDPREEWR